MIDAYEIGIHLLLQDDITAGLATINRELAEVDRAISATSAHFTNLINEAARASKAVAAARADGSARPMADQPITQEASASPEKASAVKTDAKVDTVSQPIIERTTGVSAPVEKPSASSEVTAPIAPMQATERPLDISTPSPASAAPAKEVPSQPALIQREVGVDSALPSATFERDFIAPPHGGPAIEKIDQTARLSTAPGNQPEPRFGPEVAIIASVHTSRNDGSAARSRTSESGHTHLAQPAIRERAAAPWAGINLGVQAGEGSAQWERTAAPIGPARGGGDAGGGGTVMLDGRLVGQWLADHMAHEASRPPGGTSFFDPRQTPAWTVSGAL